MERVRRNVDRIKEKAVALDFQQRTLSHRTQADIVKEMEIMQLKVEEEKSVQEIYNPRAELPCHVIAFPENKHFFERNEILATLRKVLDHDENDHRHRSMALCGNGGIGKTQVALAYAYERKRKGSPAIFWINSETTLDIAQSFTEICVSLSLEGAVKGGQHDRNQYLVMKWLEKTCGFTMTDSNLFH
jgi:DNA replication protein DnaC